MSRLPAHPGAVSRARRDDVAGPMSALLRFCGLTAGQFGGSGRAGRPIWAAAYRARAMRRATGEAPGRINLIGEHTDYNDGLVLPVALGLGVTVVARPRDNRTAHLVTDADVEPRETSYIVGAERSDGTWADRARGVTAALLGRGAPVDGFEAEISSTLPLGAGLGSSAALAVALVRALRELFDLTLDDGEIATVAHAAETEFVGARAGLMDQLASIYGRRSEALLIDLHDLSRVAVALPGELELAVIDSGTRHQHATGGYNRRREECEEAARHLGVGSLRDLEDRRLEDVLERLPPPLDRRVRHVLTENTRVRDAIAALRAADLSRLGALLDSSHRSLRDDYEVSTAELDRLVDLARDDRAVRGARLVGGGFGGSVLALTERGEARSAAERILRRYDRGRLVAVVP
ncbi:MAG: galactokinase [Chloroflexi bacterium]|nr:MAG: galactokinase [Chloroflexota bacterium]